MHILFIFIPKTSIAQYGKFLPCILSVLLLPPSFSLPRTEDDWKAAPVENNSLSIILLIIYLIMNFLNKNHNILRLCK